MFMLRTFDWRINSVTGLETVFFRNTDKFRGSKPSHTQTLMQILNPSTSAKPVMTKLQNLFVAHSKHRYLTDDT